MVLPKNITQIGETNPHCKIYVEDYVISYIRQLNQYAREKGLGGAGAWELSQDREGRLLGALRTGIGAGKLE